jgi:DNA-binding Lrp family transcriptional regulator
MPKKPDLTDLRILESLGAYGPRNITRVARELGINAETLRKRLKSMPSRIFFKYYADVYCTDLGLKKAVVWAEAIPGYENLLFDCLKTNDFWIYLSRCYGMNEGCIAYYTIPKDHSADFEVFIGSIERMKVARNVKLLWSTCFQRVNSKTRWFDEKTEKWVLSWDKWMEEIPLQDTELPRTLIDPVDYPIKADETDVCVLKELEKNPEVTLSELARVLDVSQQVVEYHYQRHILERDLIEGFNVETLHFDTTASDKFVFEFEFDSVQKCAKFAKSLMDKPFVCGLGKVLNESALIVHVYLPKSEFRKFVDTLAKLIRADLLLTYRYVILDLEKAVRQTISYEYFKDGKWVYEHEKHVKALEDLVRSQGLGEKVMLQTLG